MRCSVRMCAIVKGWVFGSRPYFRRRRRVRSGMFVPGTVVTSRVPELDCALVLGGEEFCAGAALVTSDAPSVFVIADQKEVVRRVAKLFDDGLGGEEVVIRDLWRSGSASKMGKSSKSDGTAFFGFNADDVRMLESLKLTTIFVGDSRFKSSM